MTGHVMTLGQPVLGITIHHRIRASEAVKKFRGAKTTIKHIHDRSLVSLAPVEVTVMVMSV
jgi:hypothetical protein